MDGVEKSVRLVVDFGHDARSRCLGKGTVLDRTFKGQFLALVQSFLQPNHATVSANQQRYRLFLDDHSSRVQPGCLNRHPEGYAVALARAFGASSGHVRGVVPPPDQHNMRIFAEFWRLQTICRYH